MLVSPHFLFRVELDPEPSDAAGSPNAQRLRTGLAALVFSVEQHARRRAVRRRPGAARLRKDDISIWQVKRMLQDPKAQALVENFAGQWLQLRNLKIASPDKREYPELRRAACARRCAQETELFFATIMSEDRSVLDFIDGDFTFVNERLARHYGIPDVKGDEFRRVELDGAAARRRADAGQRADRDLEPDAHFAGEARQMGAGKHAGHARRRRRRRMCRRSTRRAGAALTGSLRQRMEQHRAKPDCAVCHNRMDPLGFGLENTTPSAPGGAKTGSSRSTPRALCPAASRLPGRGS